MSVKYSKDNRLHSVASDATHDGVYLTPVQIRTGAAAAYRKIFEVDFNSLTWQFVTFQFEITTSFYSALWNVVLSTNGTPVLIRDFNELRHTTGWRSPKVYQLRYTGDVVTGWIEEYQNGDISIRHVIGGPLGATVNSDSRITWFPDIPEGTPAGTQDLTVKTPW